MSLREHPLVERLKTRRHLKTRRYRRMVVIKRMESLKTRRHLKTRRYRSLVRKQKKHQRPISRRRTHRRNRTKNQVQKTKRKKDRKKRLRGENVRLTHALWDSVALWKVACLQVLDGYLLSGTWSVDFLKISIRLIRLKFVLISSCSVSVPPPQYLLTRPFTATCYPANLRSKFSGGSSQSRSCSA